MKRLKVALLRSFGGGGTPRLNRRQEGRKPTGQACIKQDKFSICAKKESQNNCKINKKCYTSDMVHHYNNTLKRIYSPYKKAGFTLAEVLITLGIIGVVAAMTMPTLIANYQSKVYATKLKHAHNLLSNSLNLYKAKNNCDDYLCLFDTTKSSAQVAAEFSKVLTAAKLCEGQYDGKYCKYYDIKQNKPSYKVDGVYAPSDSMAYEGRIYLNNGIIYNIVQFSSCIRTTSTPVIDENGNATDDKVTYEVDSCAMIYFDTNGINPPNQFGVDVIHYKIMSDGKLHCLDENLLNNALLNGKVEYTPYNFGDEPK